MAADFTLVFAYDVERDSVRRRVSGLLERHATRVQRSVFEGRMSMKEAEALLGTLDGLIADGDSVRMYVLDEASRLRSQSIGGGPVSEKAEFWIL